MSTPPRYPLLKVIRTGDPFASYGPRPVPIPRWRAVARSVVVSLIESLIVTAAVGAVALVGGFVLLHVLQTVVVR